MSDISTTSSPSSTVNSLYLAFYGRPADPGGLKFWTAALNNAGGDINAIKSSFATSDEARVRFASDTAVERITQIYQQLFAREPDAEGLAFWVGAVNNGNVTVADVAFEVLKGARSVDRTLVDLRREAADTFTAEVEASGSAYSGYAALETARLLVQSVKPTTTKADIAALVKASKSLTEVASTSPEVIEALGDSDALVELVDSGEGAADTVTVLETLADTARSAKADAQALAALVKGGGMANILNALPEGSTIKDLVGKLGKGGLPAALKELFPDGVPSAPAKPDKGGDKGGEDGDEGEDGDDLEAGEEDGAEDALELDLTTEESAHTISYADIAETNNALVRGFDTGADKIAFSGAAAASIDTNGDGKIQWAGASAVEASSEAAVVTIDAAVLADGVPLETALVAVNGALDVSKVALNAKLLILVQAGDQAGLFQYTNQDGDGVIDAGEFNEGVWFEEGTPAQTDIVLVGSAAVPVA